MSVTLKDVGSGYKRTAINSNFEAIEAEINNSLLNKSGGVGLEADLDFNSQKAINLASGVSSSDAVNLGQLQGAISAAGGGLIASQKEVQTGADVAGSVTTFTGITYTVAGNNLYVFRNGNFQTIGTDYTETSSSSITWTTVPNSTDSLTFITNLSTTNSTTDTAAITHSQSGTNYNLATYLQNRHVVYIEDFQGVDPTGATDSTSGVQAALDLAASLGSIVKGSAGSTYLHSQLLVKNGTVAFESNGSTFLPDGSTNPDNITTEAAIVLQGAQTGGTAVDKAKISLTIDMRNGDRTAILGDGCQDCNFTNCDISGFTDDATYNHRGIRLQDDGVRGANRNEVHSNRIVGVTTPTQLGLLVEVWGVPGADFAGFFTGNIVDPSLYSLDNNIHDNRLINGSYAVNIQASVNNLVVTNVCRGQNHRSLYVANGSRENVITDNQLLDFTSSAIVLGYGARDNIFANNICVTGIFAGEAAVNINTGSSGNLISSNYIDSATNYGVYVGTDSSFNDVSNNSIKNFYLAGVHVENDIMDTPHTNATYARPNYADPTDLSPAYTSWTYNDLEGTVIQGNKFYYGYTGRNTAAISLAQMENTLVGSTLTALKNTTVKDNSVIGMDNIAYCLFVYEFATDKNTNIRYEGNTWNPDATAIDFKAYNSSGEMDLKDTAVYASGNDLLDQVIHGDGYVFTDADTTPAVQNWEFFQCANTGATSITDFDNPYEGQQILVRIDSNTTIVHNTGLIRTKTGSNITGSSNTFVRFISLSGIWIEV